MHCYACVVVVMVVVCVYTGVWVAMGRPGGNNTGGRGKLSVWWAKVLKT